MNANDERLVFESSETISVVPTFDELGLKEDLLRGIYAYSQSGFLLRKPPRKRKLTGNIH